MSSTGGCFPSPTHAELHPFLVIPFGPFNQYQSCLRCIGVLRLPLFFFGPLSEVLRYDCIDVLLRAFIFCALVAS